LGLAATLAPAYLVADLDVRRRDVRLAAVKGDVAVVDDLAGLVAGVGEAEAHHHVVQPRLQQTHQVLAGDAGLLQRALVVAAKLAPRHTVAVARLLLLAPLHAGVGYLAPPRRPRAGRVGALLNRALRAEALLALEEEFLTGPPADAAVRVFVSRHS